MTTVWMPWLSPANLFILYPGGELRQLRYPYVSGGQPLVYEVNPRISGSIVANDAAGVKLLYFGILLALGQPIPKRKELRVMQTRMVRYWTETFIHQDEWFNP